MKPSQKRRPTSDECASRHSSRRSRTSRVHPNTSTPPAGTPGRTNRRYDLQNRSDASPITRVGRPGGRRARRRRADARTCAASRTNASISSGGSCRSAAITPNTSPVPCASPVRIAANAPKLRAWSTSTVRNGAVRHAARIRARLSSGDASMTNTHSRAPANRPLSRGELRDELLGGRGVAVDGDHDGEEGRRRHRRSGHRGAHPTTSASAAATWSTSAAVISGKHGTESTEPASSSVRGSAPCASRATPAAGGPGSGSGRRC